MRRGGAKTRRWLLIGGLALLLAGTVGASHREDGAAAPAPDQEREESAFQGRGCCARAAEATEAPGCCGAGEGGCRRAMRAAGPGRGFGRGSGAQHGPVHGRGSGRYGAGYGPGRARGAHGSGRPLMPTIRSLVHEYRQEIERTVEDVEDGVVTVTRAPDSAEAAEALRRHVREARQLLETGGRIRMWDPLFRELLDHAHQISMKVEELEDGVRVTETSDDPQVVRLIRAHARKVSEFIERGPAAVHEETPLPAGYEAAG